MVNVEINYKNFEIGRERYTMTERFADPDWWCDRCGAHLNSQNNFDDYKYTWKCTECGFKNSISKDNIYESHEEYYNTGDDDSGLLRSIFKKLF